MRELTGTWVLVRFTARRERVRIVVWVVSITALVMLTAASIKGLFPTQATLDQAAAASANAAVIAFNGPAQGLDTVGGEVAFQAGTIGLILVALMSLFTTVRGTRGDEESGRTELLRAGVLGRHAPTAATLLVVTAMNVVIAAAVTTGLLAQGLPAAGSVSFGVSFLAIGLVFAALALATAQVSASSRAASGLAGAVLGYAFVMRAVGDIRGGRLSWLSPIGWSQKLRPYAGERWWPLLVPATVTVVLLGTAAMLAARRDLGAGLVAPRPGRATAAPSLSHPLGLALRLQRTALFWWCTGLLVAGFAYGAIASDVDKFLTGNQTLQELMAAAGGRSITDAYFGTAMLTLALVGCGFTVGSVNRLRSEETALHTEYVLATPTSRYRWMASHLVVALTGSVLVMSAAGLGAGIPYAAQTHDAGQIPTLLGAALVYLPAIWLLAGLTGALYGLVPRATAAAWAVLAVCFIIGFLGDVLKLPHWMVDLSPFQHTPQLPAAHFRPGPLIALLAAAAALLATGIAAFRRRDLG